MLILISNVLTPFSFQWSVKPVGESSSDSAMHHNNLYWGRVETDRSFPWELWFKHRLKLRSDIDPDGVDWILGISGVFLFVLLLYTLHTGWADSHGNKIAQSRLEAWREIKEEFISLCSSSVYMITLLGNQIITATGCFTWWRRKKVARFQSEEEWGTNCSMMTVSVWNSRDSLSYTKWKEM